MVTEANRACAITSLVVSPDDDAERRGVNLAADEVVTVVGVATAGRMTRRRRTTTRDDDDDDALLVEEVDEDLMNPAGRGVASSDTRRRQVSREQPSAETGMRREAATATPASGCGAPIFSFVLSESSLVEERARCCGAKCGGYFLSSSIDTGFQKEAGKKREKYLYQLAFTCTVLVGILDSAVYKRARLQY